MKNRSLSIAMFVCAPLCALADNTDFRAQADALVAQMSLEEKAALCSGLDTMSTKPNERLGIPAICLTDGPHGVRRPPPGARPGGDFGKNLPATCFPTASALAATWNVDLIGEVGVALGQECQALDVQILLGPGVNMKRSLLGGRNFEYYSEDPILAGRLAAAWIRGVQSQGVGTSLKHFAANNQESERMLSDSIVDERTLHEIYLPAFETAVKEGQPWTVMCSYNKLNGSYASQNALLLTDILRKDWGHRGIVVSDWGAVDDRAAGMRAGLDLEMPGSNGINDRRIVAAVIAGELDVAVLNARVRDILELTLRAHAAAKPGSTFDKNAHHALARRVAGEGIVLLKNEHVLPIEPSKSGKIAIIGRFAQVARYQGTGSSQVVPTRLDHPYAELATLVGAEKLTYAEGYTIEGGTNEALLAEARRAAKQADRAIVFVGLPDSSESEGLDRKSIDLPAGHNELVAAVAAAQPNTIVVLMNGSPVAMPWSGKVKAIVEAYLGGQATGGAIADVLTGRVNPSGKLAETFPRRIEDTPTFPNFPGAHEQALYGEGMFIGYRSFDARKIEPLFPFGFGLSYTTFAYTAIRADADEVKVSDGGKIHVTVKNVGPRDGAEVVQIYVRQLNAPVLRPDKELKKFTKVMLAPGEEKTVTFTLNSRDFARYDVRFHDWVVDSGAFEILAGGSSRDLPLKLALKVDGEQRGHPKLTRFSLVRELASIPAGRPIYDQFVQGATASLRSPDAAATPQERYEAIKARDEMVVFMNEMPLCKLVLVTGGQFSEEALQGILQTVNK